LCQHFISCANPSEQKGGLLSDSRAKSRLQRLRRIPGCCRSGDQYDINTAGQGFANDAVITTIGVEDDPTIECLDDLLDIKVANYPAGGAYESSHAKQFSHIHLFTHGTLNGLVVLFPSSVS
jgi:hypothetical protein